MLKRSEIRSMCTNNTTYSRGNEIYLKKRVLDLHWEETDHNKHKIVITAHVQGSGRSVYATRVELGHNSIQDYDCECPAMQSYWGMCKHCAAVAINFAEIQQEEERRQKINSAVHLPEYTAKIIGESQTSYQLSNLMARLNAPAANADLKMGRESVRLIPTVRFRERTRQPYHACLDMELSISNGKRPYIIKNQAKLLNDIQRGQYWEYGKQLGFTHSPEMFDAPSRKLLGYLQSSLADKIGNLHYAASVTGTEYRSTRLSNEDMDDFLREHLGARVSMDEGEYLLYEGDPKPELKIEPSRKNGAALTLPTFYLFLPSVRPWLLFGEKIYHASEEFGRVMLPILETLGTILPHIRAVHTTPAITLFLHKQDYQSFCASVLPLMEQYCSIVYDRVDFTEYQPVDPEFSFRLAVDENPGVRLDALVHYGSVSYPLFVTGTEYRNTEKEQPVRDMVREYFKQEAGSALYRAASDDEVFQLLDTGMDRLRSAGEVLIDASMKNMRISPTPKTSIGVALHGNLIDLDVEVEGLPPEEMGRLLSAYRQKKRYYRLKNGEFLALEDGGLSVVHELAEGLLVQGKNVEHLQLPAYRAQYINDVVTASQDIELKRSTDFRKVIRSLRSFADSDYTLPEALHATLRGYQQEGYLWMCSLADCQLGGILADEMGLGKTLQSIAFLLHTGENALIICPASLLYNWESEIHRFAPTLKVQPISGNAAQRREVLAQEADVYVTSYDLLKRDIRDYAARSFGTVLIDEAQYIRNAGTQAAKAVKQLNANHRFALTGTPIENRLSDLWSIFDFLMPEFLYRYPDFKATLEQPIIDGDEQARERLKKMISPFILRRKKNDVLKELPEKVENVQYVDMTDTQRAQYLAREQQLRESLLKDDDSVFNANRIQYLSALTRLRQVCCDPALFLEDYHGGSGKTDACMELLAELTDTGHKVLVFSQFTSMLDILRAEAEKRGMASLYLTGASTKEQRRDMVLEFQNGSTMVFFISLKAGGTGLNLTAADRVIHVDPWWNAAAEDQASDRTHRIGQKNTVFITKLVAQNTVEERILALQQAKRELSEGVLSGEGIGEGKITREELLALLQER